MEKVVLQEGFKGERLLTVVSVVLGIVSAALLIRLTLLQHTYFNNQLKKQNGGGGVI